MTFWGHIICFYYPLGYGRVYLPLYKVADTSFHIQWGDLQVDSCAFVMV